MAYSGRTLVRTVQHGTDWSKKIPRKMVQALGPMDSIDALLEKPTWSVRSLLPPQQPAPTTRSDISDTTSESSTTNGQTRPPPPTTADSEITPAALHHLLRLSALPLPSSSAAESRLLSDLRSQVHFVKHLQSVDTSNVTPLVSIRDETAAARDEQMVTLEEMLPWLEQEEQVGKNGTVRRRKTDVQKAEKEKRAREAAEAEERRFPGAERFEWKDLKASGWEEGRRWGGYYVVKKEGKKGKEGQGKTAAAVE